MGSEHVYLTKEGQAQLQVELEQLRDVERLELIERLAEAKAGGDWMDNTEHGLVEDELAFVEARIRELEYMLKTARLIPPDSDPIRINVGDTVMLEVDGGQLERYTIVGSVETDPAAGKISNESPLGRALLDHQVGDELEIQAPAGPLRVRVVALE